MSDYNPSDDLMDAFDRANGEGQDDTDQGEPPELEYVIDAYVKVWATSYEEAMERADIALAEMYGKHGVAVDTFDAYGINGPDGEEIREVH